MVRKAWVFVVLLLLVGAASAELPLGLVSRVKAAYSAIDSMRAASVVWPRTPDVSELTRLAKVSKQLLRTESAHLPPPLYERHGVTLDSRIDLLDFCLYPYTENYYQYCARLRNRSAGYLEWVKLRINLYRAGTLVGSDFSYIDFESYDPIGISPYQSSLLFSFVNKVAFDSVEFRIEYELGNGRNSLLWDQLLTVESVLISPFGEYHKWQGTVRNGYGYSVRFPCVHACVLKEGRMMTYDFTYLDVPNNAMPAYGNASFDSFLELPQDYDEIQYSIDYALSSLEGSGNLPPNRPIFTRLNQVGRSRVPTSFELFLIDHESEKLMAVVDFGDGTPLVQLGPFFSGGAASVQHTYQEAGTYCVRACARDAVHESQWSGSLPVGISASPGPKITTAFLPVVVYLTPCSIVLSRTGGIEPVTWELRAGGLPPGLVLRAEGALWGIAERSGSFEIEVFCRDSGVPSLADSARLSLTVVNHRPMIISPRVVEAVVSTPFGYTAEATDPDANPLQFHFFDYPQWMVPVDKRIEGLTPPVRTSASFGVVATDGELSDSLLVSVFVRPLALRVISQRPLPAAYRHPYVDTLRATGGVRPYTWAVVGGALPAGLQLEQDGLLHGEPQRSGDYFFNVRVTDADSPPQVDSVALDLLVTNRAPRITSPRAIESYVSAPVTYVAEAEDPDGNPVSFAFWNYPIWLAPLENVLRGTAPDTAGATGFLLVASDGELCDSASVAIRIVAVPLQLSTKELPPATYEVSYAETLKAVGGTPPYRWRVQTGSLPDGLTLAPHGVLAGQPRHSGEYAFAVRVEDSAREPQFDTVDLNLTVLNHCPAIISADTVCVAPGGCFSYTAEATDPDGNAVLFEFACLPSWIAAEGDKLVGTAPATPQDTSFVIIASDGELSDTLVVSVRVLSTSVRARWSGQLASNRLALRGVRPNPASRAACIELFVPAQGLALVQLYDVQGRLLRSMDVPLDHVAVHSLQLPISDLPSGAYLVRVIWEKQSSSAKLLVLK
ncbi:MAG: putative Ig domain-containing protein [candidate division KSB1 bacterium]|nr:putative Ig domain-containing protein [candidate division KSB1 bacterium]